MCRISTTLVTLSLSALVGACGRDKSADSPADSSDSGVETGDTSTPAPVSPCSDGTWGALDDPTTAWDDSGASVGDPLTAIQVRVDGDDGGDGGLEAPVASLARALELSRARETDKVIFVGPGVYEGVSLSVQRDPGDGSTDDGLVIAGCRDEVELDAASADEPVLRVSEAQGVLLYDLALVGGTRALWIWTGATVSVTRVKVRRSGVVGVIMDGPDTLVLITDLDVSDTDDGDDAPGVALGAGVLGATVRWSGGTVSKSRTAGILVSGDGRSGELELRDVTVSDTAADDAGHYGRGIQIQDALSASLSACTISDSADAGLFVLQSPSLTVDGLTVSGVEASEIPDETETSGDGIVVTSDDGSGASLDPAGFTANLSGSEVSGYARAGVLLEDVTADLTGNEVSGGLYGVAAQGSAVVTGDVTPDVPPEDLRLNRVVLDADALTSE